MIRIKVPILTTEYSVVIFVGKKSELIPATVKYCNSSLTKITNDFENRRGACYNGLTVGKHPLIVVDGDFDGYTAIATLAHEAVHAVLYIADYIGMEDKSGEFLAHGVGKIMRTFFDNVDIMKIKK